MLLTKDLPKNFWQFETIWNQGFNFSSPKDKAFVHWSTSDFIRAIREFSPYSPIRLDGKAEKTLRTRYTNHYDALADWLEYSLIEMPVGEREEFRQRVQLTYRVSAKPEADFSIAIRELCRQIHGRDTILSEAPSFEHLWFLAESSNCLLRSRIAGLFTAIPAFFNCGRRVTVANKKETAERNSVFIATFKEALKSGQLEEEELFPNEDWKENFLSILVIEAVKIAIKEDGDGDMSRHSTKFLKSFKDFTPVMSSSNYQGIYLAGDHLIEPGRCQKAMTASQSLSLCSPSERRSRGRPPKGQERKFS